MSINDPIEICLQGKYRNHCSMVPWCRLSMCHCGYPAEQVGVKPVRCQTVTNKLLEKKVEVLVRLAMASLPLSSKLQFLIT